MARFSGLMAKDVRDGDRAPCLSNVPEPQGGRNRSAKRLLLKIRVSTASLAVIRAKLLAELSFGRRRRHHAAGYHSSGASSCARKSGSSGIRFHLFLTWIVTSFATPSRGCEMSV
jgi:hypothetical protein